MKPIDSALISAVVLIVALPIVAVVDLFRRRQTNWRNALLLLFGIPTAMFVLGSLVEAGGDLKRVGDWITGISLIGGAGILVGAILIGFYKYWRIKKTIKGRGRMEIRDAPDGRRFSDCPACGAEVEVSPMAVGALAFECKLCGFRSTWKG